MAKKPNCWHRQCAWSGGWKGACTLGVTHGSERLTSASQHSAHHGPSPTKPHTAKYPVLAGIPLEDAACAKEIHKKVKNQKISSSVDDENFANTHNHMTTVTCVHKILQVFWSNVAHNHPLFLYLRFTVELLEKLNSFPPPPLFFYFGRLHKYVHHHCMEPG